MAATRSELGRFVADAHAAGRLVVQPRMGFSNPASMRDGLLATREVSAATVGTITLDSYTRLGDQEAGRRALDDGVELNGYPILLHPPATTRAVLADLTDGRFPVQVRHGSPAPERIFDALVRLGIGASEGGPVSYCLPYGRSPLRVSVNSWKRACDLLVRLREQGVEPHLETFGGCLLGQLCPPGLLVAVSVLEGVFFAHHGLRCISLSYAQQVDTEQDLEALAALRTLAARFLPGVAWHVVVYAYMGLYPRTRRGANALLAEAARLAVRGGAERLIVKTVAEADRIPTVEENVAALHLADTAAAMTPRGPVEVPDTGLLAEATALVEAVLSLHDDVGTALLTAFGKGYLDVPYCLHPDNARRTAGRIDGDGRLVWADTGALPVPRPVRDRGTGMNAGELLTALRHVRDRFDFHSSGVTPAPLPMPDGTYR
ncbi:methylaspartate mutase [Nonomuraea angiospora]|uniref:methylaspartate mutase n=1 Tax=Nonomuraea angiospora TaxID=46172 RepID=UPI00344EE82D